MAEHRRRGEGGGELRDARSQDACVTAAATTAETAVATPAKASPEPADPPDDALIGQTFDRYRVLSRLGAGGMGVVYVALDPALDRKVALKVLPQLGELERSLLETRLRREAQALARLDHPNVVTVYDVGFAEHSVFLAMQLVDGTTLDRQLGQRVHRPAEVIELFVAAARGLAAAHAAGIVHRDFKPSNVLVARDGRVRVGDFGLARGDADADPDADPDAEPAPIDRERGALLAEPVTRVGAVVGTPLYMAPEQHRGEPATARSDQFSFCVALWQALFGEHPFVAGRATRAAIAEVMSRDSIRPRPPVRGVSRRIVRALRRGLHHDPAARWAAMTELIVELVPRSRPRWVLAGVTVAGLGGGVALASVVGGTGRVDPCVHAGDAIAEVWGPRRSAAITAAFAASGLPIALDTAARATDAIATHAAAWSAARIDACRATRSRGVQSDQLLDRRMRCLDGRLAELDGLLAIFAAPDREVVTGAVAAIGRLSPLAACADSQALIARTPPPVEPGLRARVDQLAKETARGVAALKAGRLGELGAQIGKLETDARATAWEPLIAEVVGLAGSLEKRLAHYPAAIAKLREAALIAARAGDPRGAATALADAADAMTESGHPADALLVVADAEIVAGPGRDQLGAQLHSMRGAALRELSRYHDADEEYAKAVAAETEHGGTDPLALARLFNSWANVINETGDTARAEPMYRRALEIFERQLGPDHPNTGAAVGNLALLLINAHRPGEAGPLLERALAVKQKNLPADHPSIANTLLSMAAVRRSQDRPDEAERLTRDAIGIMHRALGSEHLQTLQAEYGLASHFRQTGRVDEAIALHRQVLTRKIAALGPEHRSVSNSLDALGRAHSHRADREAAAGRADRARADYAAATDHFARARTLRATLYGQDSLDVASTSVALAEVALATGDCARAIREAEPAAAYYRTKQITADPDRAGALFAIAQCRHRLGQRRAARQALDELTALGEPSQIDLGRLAAGHLLLAELLWADGEQPAAIAAATRAADLARRGDDAAQRAAVERWVARHRPARR